MVRSEFIITGFILVTVGIGLCIVGYNKMQPTALEKTVTFLEQISDEKAPAELRTSKTEGHLFLGIGGLAFLIGIGLILGSRMVPGSRTRDSKEEGLDHDRPRL